MTSVVLQGPVLVHVMFLVYDINKLNKGLVDIKTNNYTNKLFGNDDKQS